MQNCEISFFKNAASHEPVTVSISQIIEGIRTGRWDKEILAIRRALAQGDKKQAADLKRQLPYVSFGGVFEGGHKANQLTKYSQRIVLDLDNTPPQELARLQTLCREQECVEAVYVTPSNQGLKVVVATDGTAETHAQSFAAVTAYFDRLLGHESDHACKDISRGHFVSYDPEAFYREVTRPFHVEGEELTTGSPAAEVPKAEISDEEVDRFVSSYLTLYPAKEGNRNNQLFRLSCEARKRGIESGTLQQAAVRKMTCADFSEWEITQAVKSAYSREIEPASPPAGSKGQRKGQSPLDPNNSAEGMTEDSENSDGEELREKTPVFPESVFEALPDILHTGLKFVTGKREQDMLLLAMITVISSLLHRVTAYYAGKRYWANLYTFVVAAAASNKGVMENALVLGKYFFKETDEANEVLEKGFRKATEAYEQAIRQKSKGKNDDSQPVRPEEPAYCYPQIPADISKSRLLIHQRDNKEKGGLMFDLEADTLSAAGKQDYGNFFDFLRKFFQHEPTSASFKANGKPIYVACPRLSVLLAGTPAQFCRMIPYSENGLLSRFLLYTLRQPAEWMDVSPRESEENKIENHFDQLAMRVNQAIHFLDSSPTRIRLTRKQWQKLNRTFGDLLKESILHEREDFQSCVKRHGLMTLRVCMVFTALEKASLRMPAEEIYCSDAHFEAALALVTCCLEHSRLLITSTQTLDKDARELQNPNKAAEIFNSLPRQFTTADFAEQALKRGLSATTAKRLLKNAIELKIKKVKRGVYRRKD